MYITVVLLNFKGSFAYPFGFIIPLVQLTYVVSVMYRLLYYMSRSNKCFMELVHHEYQSMYQINVLKVVGPY